MPSPFPGMDPFIEEFEWDDFHLTAAVYLADIIQPELAPHLVARRARRVYREQVGEGRRLIEEHRETYVEIREKRDRCVVTRIEFLSPTNKRPGSTGNARYLSERRTILNSPVNLVELDLLRGGERLPMSVPLPRGDYFAIVSASRYRPRAEVYPWFLEARMPRIAIPLTVDK